MRSQYIKIKATASSSGLRYWVRYWDWRGKLIFEEQVESGSNSTPPAVATADNAVFYGWIGDYTNITEDTDIYAEYTTVDDATYIHLNLNNDTGLSPTLRITNYYTGAVIYWGDGSSEIIGTGSTVNLTHTYAAASTYVAKITATSVWRMGQGYMKGLVTGNYVYACSQILIGTKCDLYYQAIYEMTGLKYLLLPHGMQALSASGAGSNNKALRHLTFPSSLTAIPSFTSSTSLMSLRSLCFPNPNIVADNFSSGLPLLKSYKFPASTTNIPSYFLYGATQIEKLIIPSSVTSIGTLAFASMSSLRNITIPNGITVIKATLLSSCYSLEKVEFGTGVTTIEATIFSSTFNLQTVIFNSVTPPTITTTSLNTPNLSCLYYVPDASVDAYKAAANFSSIASRILPKSQLLL